MILGVQKARNNSLCKLNLRMDGSNDGTTFTDSSPSGRSVTRYNAVTKTATKKFGTASGYFNGTNAYLELADSADLQFANRFTIEFWVIDNNADGTYSAYYGNKYFTSGNDYGFVMRQVTGTTSFRAEQAYNSFVLDINTGDINANDGNWRHYAVVRTGTTVKLYVDGILKANGSYSYTLGNNAGVKSIGESGYATTRPHTPHKGYIDSFTLHKNKAIWLNNFKVPNRAS